jgi:hypothetical protein
MSFVLVGSVLSCNWGFWCLDVAGDGYTASSFHVVSTVPVHFTCGVVYHIWGHGVLGVIAVGWSGHGNVAGRPSPRIMRHLFLVRVEGNVVCTLSHTRLVFATFHVHCGYRCRDR